MKEQIQQLIEDYERRLATTKKEIADNAGKMKLQRLNAIIGFVRDEYEDIHGNLFSDLSMEAQYSFRRSQSISYAEMEENTTDQDVLDTFLTVNFTGVPMSQEHIDYIKTIRLK